jgi:acyl-CoA thioesterase FadM
LFQPVLSSTATPLTDCDYNMHKSNSTYFADLDLARVHLLGALGFGAQPKGAPMPALGGVSCNFRRPVAPLQRMHIYTRVLSWDAKWLYIASWIVRADPKAAKPVTWTLQPWRRGASGASAGPTGAKAPDVCAVALARYVFKKGRVTVAPDPVLTAMGLLPAASEQGQASAASGVDHADRPPAPAWTASAAEQERLRGLEVAQSMAGLDGLLDGLRPAEGPALGEW